MILPDGCMNYGTARQLPTRRACVPANRERVYPFADCQMGIEFTRRRRPTHAPPSRHPFLSHARNQNTCAGGRRRCRCSSKCVRVERTRTVTFPVSKGHPARDQRQLQSLSATARSDLGVDRFPALDANAEITPCDPLDRLSGV